MHTLPLFVYSLMRYFVIITLFSPLLGSSQITYLKAQVVNIGDNATVNVTGKLLVNSLSLKHVKISYTSKFQSCRPNTEND